MFSEIATTIGKHFRESCALALLMVFVPVSVMKFNQKEYQILSSDWATMNIQIKKLFVHAEVPIRRIRLLVTLLPTLLGSPQRSPSLLTPRISALLSSR